MGIIFTFLLEMRRDIRLFGCPRACCAGAMPPFHFSSMTQKGDETISEFYISTVR